MNKVRRAWNYIYVRVRFWFINPPLIIRNLPILTLSLFATIVLSILIVAAYFINRKRWDMERKGNFMWYIAHQYWSPLIFDIARIKVAIKGSENINWNRPHIIAPNHTSVLDHVLLAYVIPHGGRFVLKREIFKFWFVGSVLKRAGQVAIDRGKPGESKNILEGIEKWGNCNLIIYPEGTRSRDGKLGLFRRGAAFAAVRTGFEIIPVAIKGGYEALPPGPLLGLKMRSEIEVLFGEGISPDNKNVEDLTDIIRREIVRRLE